MNTLARIEFVCTLKRSLKGRYTRRDKSLRLVPSTGPGDQVPSCELPIFIKKVSRIGPCDLSHEFKPCLSSGDKSPQIMLTLQFA